VSLSELARPVGRTLASCLPFIVPLILVGQLAPEALPFAAVLAWLGAFGLSVRNSREARGLLSKTYG
jgi:hypothetical protein